MAPNLSGLEHHSTHEPNLDPPYPEPEFILVKPDGSSLTVRVEELATLPRTSLEQCYIVSTGHGTSGPFVFSGVKIKVFILQMLPELTDWTLVEVIGADGFGAKLQMDDLVETEHSRPILLADSINGQPMTRRQGLVRLIVPDERDDALRQVKWVAQVRVL
jgi:hypothetical protein